MIGVPLCNAATGLRRLLATATVAVLLIAGMLVGAARPAAAATGDLRMHDPSVIRVGDCYYGFSTGFEDGPWKGPVTIRKTCDSTLYSGWTFVGKVWETPPDWIAKRLGATPPNFWAPDINYFNGKFHLYYAASFWSTSKATMGLLTATDIEGPWTDQGEVTSVAYPIDPNVTWVGETAYISWGSFAGVYMHVLDPATGKLSTTDHNLWKLSTGIENPTIAQHGGYFYLFGSRGTCCRGLASDYYTVVGRSEKISGPYLDRNGVDLTRGGGTLVMRGRGTQNSAGGGDLFADGPATRMAYHFYDATANGRETLNVRRVTFADGWPTVGPPVGEYPATNLRLTNRHSGKVLASPVGHGDVVEADWTGANAEQWQFEDLGDGYVRIANRASDRCLDVANVSTVDGANVIQWSCGNGHNQQWRVESVGSNIQLVARHSGMCLTVAQVPGQAASNVVQSSCVEGADTMLWTREVADPPRPVPPVRYEAEAPGNTRQGGAVTAACAECSQRKKVRFLGSSGTSGVTFTGVTAESTGSVLLTIAYTNGEAAARRAAVRVNGTAPRTVTFPATGSPTRPGTVSMIVSLVKGENTVAISSPTGAGADLDGLTVEPLPGT